MPKRPFRSVLVLAPVAVAAVIGVTLQRRHHAASASTESAASNASISPTASSTSAVFVQAVTRGNGFFEKGDADQAIAHYTEALRFSPANTDALLNLANALLLAGQAPEAVDVCERVLAIDHNSAAAYYLLGCAHLRQNQAEPAVQAFQQSWKIDRTIPALDFQMGLAQAKLGQTSDAIRDFEEVVRAVPNHPSAHYQLSRLLQQTGRSADAARELQTHQQILAQAPHAASDVAALERCQYTQALAPFVLAEPAENGLAIRFVDTTAAAFAAAANFRGPIAALDYAGDGRVSLFALDPQKGFTLLENQGGHFSPLGASVAAKPDGGYRDALVGDIDNDGFPDVVVLGETDSRVFKFYAQGHFRDATRSAGLSELKARTGMLGDLDFTGNLDLVTIAPDGTGLSVYRNLGNFFFDNSANDSGLSAEMSHVESLASEDWQNEGLPGIFVSRSRQAPLYYAKKRAAAYASSTLAQNWPAGILVATADLNNDLHPDAILTGQDELLIVYGALANSPVSGPAINPARSNEPAKVDGTESSYASAKQKAEDMPGSSAAAHSRPANERTEIRHVVLNGLHVRGVLAADLDNDGWLDLIAYGDNGIRVWRNRGQLGFVDVTKDYGLDGIASASQIIAADFDRDGDLDLVICGADGLHFWRNDGANTNHLLTLQLQGKRSNASALGVRVEAIAGSWRTSRTVRGEPLTIGVGAYQKIDALKEHWFDLSTAQVDVPVKPELLTLTEPTLPSGSCPYLFAWNGERFDFVTDILGAAPLGLPVSAKQFIDADPEEYLNLGDAKQFPAREGVFEVRIAEELREVLFLDNAELVAVDHPVGTLVFPTSKLLPRPPFPPHELWILRPLGTPRHAARNDGTDETAALGEVDGNVAGPVALRPAQLRGLAEPFSVTLDFGELPADRPLVLALTGWLRFGGGMANIAASLDAKLPYPFPGLEAQRANGSWQKVDVEVGAPAGKTKTILVDLTGKLPPDTRALRLSTAFEIYWDRALLCEKIDVASPTAIPLKQADLHWRGFSRYENWPPSRPLTPRYQDVSPTPPWDRTPGGWVTRYGDVRELVEHADDRLALLDGGDELSLRFDATATTVATITVASASASTASPTSKSASTSAPGASVLPASAPLASEPAKEMIRDYFLHVVGWDKDADFHVGSGWKVEPLPFRGMHDQEYGHESRPPKLDETWIKKYNTRWVGPTVVSAASDGAEMPPLGSRAARPLSK